MDNKRQSVKPSLEIRDKIFLGLEEAYRRLVEFKKQKNSPLVISRNGKVVEVDPHEVSPTITYKRD